MNRSTFRGRRGGARKGASGASGGRANRSGNAMAPPQIKSNIVITHKYRYTASSAVSGTSFNAGNLVLSAGSMCTVTNTTVTSLFSSVKVDAVEIWSPPASQGSFATCAIEWNGSAAQAVAANLEISDTSVSTAQPAHLRSHPPPQSLAGFWQTPGIANNALFVLNCPAGSIVDVTMSLIMNDDEDTAIAGGVATGVLGKQYILR